MGGQPVHVHHRRRKLADVGYLVHLTQDETRRSSHVQQHALDSALHRKHPTGKDGEHSSSTAFENTPPTAALPHGGYSRRGVDVLSAHLCR